MKREGMVLAALGSLLWMGTAHAAPDVDAVDARLAAMGVSNAASHAAADSYVHRLRSACAKLVGRALAGDKDAAHAIDGGSTSCTS